MKQISLAHRPIRSTTKIWVIHVTSIEFLQSFLRRHFAGKPVMASWNVGCFLRLHTWTLLQHGDKWEVLGFWNLLVDNLVLVSSPARGIYKASRTKIMAQPKWRILHQALPNTKLPSCWCRRRPWIIVMINFQFHLKKIIMQGSHKY